MVFTDVQPKSVTDYTPRPKRTRFDSPKHYNNNGGTCRKELELADVIDVLGSYVDYGGGVNCCVCGKLYKSKVCLIKHIWEHSVYWDLFDGAKNHERVLSIQAALILYRGNHSQKISETDTLMNLLVTAPNMPERKKDNALPQPPKISQFQTFESSPLKRKRCD